MGVPAEEFLRKLREFDSLIKYAAYRYRIPGVLDQEDLYQEGLLILDNMFRKYNFTPDSDDFRKLFKTELWHGLNNILQRHKQSKRDWRKVVNNDFSYLDYAAEEESDAASSDSIRASAKNPEEIVQSREDSDEVTEFVERLTERLDDEARVVLSELLHPRAWEDIPAAYRVNQNEDDYWRRPRRGIPRHIIADLLGFPKIRVKRAVKRIRRAAAEVAAELGLDLMAKASFKWLAKRKKKDVESEPEVLLSSAILQPRADSDSFGSGASDYEDGMENVLSSEG